MAAIIFMNNEIGNDYYAIKFYKIIIIIPNEISYRVQMLLLIIIRAKKLVKYVSISTTIKINCEYIIHNT